MCGIAGIVSLDGQLEDSDRKTVRAMTGVLRHRGPDSTDFFDSYLCSCGNTRLKIIDLSDNAMLPISNEDGSIVLCYNGEVTNFRQLRRKYNLDDKHRFRSSSDSEVLVHLYEELGLDFVLELNGMFAFFLFDAKKRMAYLVRDFFGLRPAFYMVANGKFYFASELKSFFEIPGFEPTPDLQALYHFFTLAYIPGEMTPYEQVRELRAGCMVELDLAKLSFFETCYYSLDRRPFEGIDEIQAVDKVRELLEKSVERNMIADTPVGINLSGGVDSSAIAALLPPRSGKQKVHAFSLKINEASFDESRFQRVVADRYPLVRHEVEINACDILDNIAQVMAYMDEPIGNGAVIPSYLLSKYASKYVPVLLSGEGGDEIFLAYDTYAACRVRNMYRRFVPGPLRALNRKILDMLPVSHRKLSFDFKAKRFARGAEMDVVGSHVFWRHAFSRDQKHGLFETSIGGVPFMETEDLFRTAFDAQEIATDIDGVSGLDLQYYFVDDLMLKHDRTAMPHSVESRFPYLDRELVEFVVRIPAGLRMKGGKRRYIQKQALRDIVPDCVLDRPKMGLEIPYSAWFVGPFRDRVEKLFSRECVESTGILDYKVVSSMWEEHKQMKRDNGRALWSLVSFLVWAELFLNSRDYKKYLR